MVDSDKVAFDLSHQENLQSALLGVFDSQITGGKRYDLASLARRRANATYFESHGVDLLTGLSFGLDMTSLIQIDDQDPASFIQTYINNFAPGCYGTPATCQVINRLLFTRISEQKGGSPRAIINQFFYLKRQTDKSI